VRPEGKGWVYYNASGHDGQIWTRPEFKGQVRRALQWGYQVKQSFTGVRGALAGNPFLRLRAGRLVAPLRGAYSLEVLDLEGRRILFDGPATAGNRDLSKLPAGTYGVLLYPEHGDALRALILIQ
jgi:hypothetical protein